MAPVMVLSMRKNWIAQQIMDITVCIVDLKPREHLLVLVVCLIEQLHLLQILSSPSYLLLELTHCMVSKCITVHLTKIPSASIPDLMPYIVSINSNEKDCLALKFVLAWNSVIVKLASLHLLISIGILL